mmetsp:Transcript_24816/g.56581  ORF Transcript_24816/g.56581 Transcript_24816/m.56581 type:complete len:210 (-) Transcript_24816:428-1057(-)
MLEVFSHPRLAGQVHRKRDSSQFVPGELLVFVELSQGRLSLLFVHQNEPRRRLVFAVPFPCHLRFQPPLSLRDVAGDPTVGVAGCRGGPRRSRLYATAECYVELRSNGRRPRRHNASLVSWHGGKRRGRKDPSLDVREQSLFLLGNRFPLLIDLGLLLFFAVGHHRLFLHQSSPIKSDVILLRFRLPGCDVSSCCLAYEKRLSTIRVFK